MSAAAFDAFCPVCEQKRVVHHVRYRGTRICRGCSNSAAWQRTYPHRMWQPPTEAFVPDLRWGWLAGIVDGEGCIKARTEGRIKPSVELVVGMTCEKSVRRCREITGVGRISIRTINPHKPLFLWAVYADAARDVLWRLLPLLVTKEAAASEILEGGDAA